MRRLLSKTPIVLCVVLLLACSKSDSEQRVNSVSQSAPSEVPDAGPAMTVPTIRSIAVGEEIVDYGVESDEWFWTHPFTVNLPSNWIARTFDSSNPDSTLGWFDSFNGSELSIRVVSRDDHEPSGIAAGVDKSEPLSWSHQLHPMDTSGFLDVIAIADDDHAIRWIKLYGEFDNDNHLVIVNADIVGTFILDIYYQLVVSIESIELLKKKAR